MTTLLDAALKATFIFAVAWTACFLLRRRSADLRHKIWLAAIVSAAALPLITPQMPAAQIGFAATAAPPVKAAVQAVRAFPWTFAIWLTGALLVFSRIIFGIARIAWITKRAEKRDGVYLTQRVATPMTWGFAVVMPEWNEIAIRHERAHIERLDWFSQVFARIVTAVFWFHPLMWIADAALRREAELAVDDRLLGSGVDAAEYAETLLNAARAALPAVVAMTPPLETRVRAILDPSRPRFGTSWKARAVIAAGTLAIVLPLAAFQDRTVHKIGEQGVRPPRVISKVEPQYTQEAKDARIEGTTAVRCTINESGRAENIEVLRSLDGGLDLQAINAVSQWEFAPGEKDGQPVAVIATIEINWRLK